MKLLIVLAVIATVAYFLIVERDIVSPSEPVFVEIRIQQADSSVLLVGVGRMESMRDCRARSRRFWEGVFNSKERFRLVSSECKDAIADRYLRLFNDEQMHATYLALDRGNPLERDGRFVIYGVPSSQAARECPRIIQQIQKRYSGPIRCIQGTVG